MTIFIMFYDYLNIMQKLVNNSIMKSLFLIRNQEIFQGEKYLRNNKKYFEGWYFKNNIKENGISFIPGININNKGKNAFIQIITDNSSYFIDYDINEFMFNNNDFSINIGKNHFSKDGIHIDIKNEQNNLSIYGNLHYFNNKDINMNLLNPNIMGPFSYVPFMECNHAIITMQNNISGFIKINNNKIDFTDGKGYIEKDWGCSFPTSYIWCQGNNFQNSDASFMCSVADINFELFNFKGIICVLIIGDKEFRFTTYNTTKLEEYKVDDNSFHITLKKGSYYLNISSKYNNAQKLSAPVKGKMEKTILESISAKIEVTLRKENNIIFSDSSMNCGIEIV